jgi:fermentation-respiration switch protein FrsA (DUF1100 family)
VLVFEVSIIAGLLYVAIYFVANRLMYHPARYPKGWWEMQAELGAQDVLVRTRDGLSLHAWWLEAPASRIVTLYLHGNNGNIASRPGHLREMTGAGSSVLIVDYRGYGRNRGWPTERGLYCDADAGYDYLISQGYQPTQIVVHGESLGSAVAVDLGSRRPCAALILECPFTSAADMAGRTVPVLGPLFVRGFNARRKIAGVRAPLLIIHGDEDPVVPIAMGRALFEAANEPKSFWAVEGARHKTIVQVAGPRYRARLQAFYESLGLGISSETESPERRPV